MGEEYVKINVRALDTGYTQQDVSCLNLWLAVLIRIIDDAAGMVTLEGGHSSGNHAQIQRARYRDYARWWLFGSKAGDLEWICQFLGLDPYWVRKIASERIKANEVFYTRSIARIKRNHRHL